MEYKETFIALTGCLPDEVDQWFQLGDNNLDRSVELYFNMNSLDSSAVNLSDIQSNYNFENSKSIKFDSDIRDPDSVKKQRLIESDDEFEIENNIDSQFSENVNPDTDKIRFKGSFENAKKNSNKNKKLLIVSLQLESDLDSMNLNRNIWNDDTVISLIENKFIFFQTYYKSKVCKTICSLYNIYELPTILIINPKTGSLVWNYNNKIQKMDILSVLTDLDYSNCNKDLFEILDDLSCKRIIDEYESTKLLIEENKKIVLKVQLNREKFDLITSKDFTIKDLAIQFSRIIYEKNNSIDKIDIYYDFPHKHLLKEIKDNISNLPKLGDFNYGNFRFIVRQIDI